MLVGEQALPAVFQVATPSAYYNVRGSLFSTAVSALLEAVKLLKLRTNQN
jgi:hypothetical protein